MSDSATDRKIFALDLPQWEKPFCGKNSQKNLANLWADNRKVRIALGAAVTLVCVLFLLPICTVILVFAVCFCSRQIIEKNSTKSLKGQEFKFSLFAGTKFAQTHKLLGLKFETSGKIMAKNS